MAVSLIPRVERGRLYLRTADLFVPTVIQAADAPKLTGSMPSSRCSRSCALSLRVVAVMNASYTRLLTYSQSTLTTASKIRRIGATVSRTAEHELVAEP